VCSEIAICDRRILPPRWPTWRFGGSHTSPSLGTRLSNAGARAVIADMRALKSTVVALRSW
jgi:hypothetical protein